MLPRSVLSQLLCFRYPPFYEDIEIALLHKRVARTVPAPIFWMSELQMESPQDLRDQFVDLKKGNVLAQAEVCTIAEL